MSMAPTPLCVRAASHTHTVVSVCSRLRVLAQSKPGRHRPRVQPSQGSLFRAKALGALKACCSAHVAVHDLPPLELDRKLDLRQAALGASVR